MSDLSGRYFCPAMCNEHFATSQELEDHILDAHPWLVNRYPDPNIYATNAGSTSTSGFDQYTSNVPNTGYGFNTGYPTMGPAQAEPSNPTGAGHSDSEGSADGYQCVNRDCGATFPTLGEVLDHMVVHDSIVGVFCGVGDCGEYFHTQEELDAHVAQVHGDDAPEAGPSQAGPSQVGPSQAGPSQAGSSQAGPVPAGPPPAGPVPAGLAPAGRARAGRGRERCNICGRMVTNISAHVGRVHNREKHWQCHHCTDTFFGAPELRKHLRIEHGLTLGAVGRVNARRPTWRCSSCHFVGPTLGALNAHRNTVHPGPIVGNAPLVQQPNQQPNQPQVNDPGAQTQEQEDVEDDVEMQD